jgi:hypothetical protein
LIRIKEEILLGKTLRKLMELVLENPKLNNHEFLLNESQKMLDKIVEV